jgi:hypothetical protein
MEKKNFSFKPKDQRKKFDMYRIFHFSNQKKNVPF